MNQPTVSVIIPVYNGENDLARCVDSVLDQSYPALEIFLIDDGSTDRTGEICDAYARKDRRIQVIHKENEGSSVARNLAVEKATGEMLSFIDSDDILSADLYEICVAAMIKHQVDMVRYDHCITLDKLGLKTGQPLEKILPAEEVTTLILTDTFGSQLWQYLFKKQLWVGIVSPKGRLAQDMAVLHLATDRAEQCLCLKRNLYYYYQTNPHNVSNANRKRVKGTSDRAYVYWERVAFCRAKGQTYLAVLPQCLAKATEYSLSAFLRCDFWTEEQYATDRKRFLAEIRRNLWAILTNHQSDCKRKGAAVLCALFPFVFRWVAKGK